MYALSTPTDQHTPRQICHLHFISQFATDIRKDRDADNSTADTLFQIKANALHTDKPPVTDFKGMAADQHEYPEFLKLQTSPSSLTFTDIPLPTLGSTIVCLTSTNVRSSPCCSNQVRSYRVSLTPLTVTPWYPSNPPFGLYDINADVRKWAQCCLQCKQSKVP